MKRTLTADCEDQLTGEEVHRAVLMYIAQRNDAPVPSDAHVEVTSRAKKATGAKVRWREVVEG